jgi:hypothetical protein
LVLAPDTQSGSIQGDPAPLQIDPPTHPCNTQLKNNIRKPKQRTYGSVTYLVVRTPASEPISHIDALKHPLWCQAMNDEFEDLIKNKTWHLIPPRDDLKIIYCKWVFKLKQRCDGSIDRYKTRLVSKGFKQEYGIDYQETSVQSSNPPPFGFYYPLQLLVDRSLGKLIFKMHSCMVFLMKILT